MKLAAAALIALCSQVALASIGVAVCKGKPPSNWGPPNCSAEDEATCADICINRTKCSNKIGREPQYAGYCMDLLGPIWDGNAVSPALGPAPVRQEAWFTSGALITFDGKEKASTKVAEGQ
ncbi:hypothetical protein CMUS01_14496 [Colletotrichum musicola]|uniref:Uncharacterized protein n=1 Tax=Colletotrichum musicola TaxID=2175873 RepID=A0A8H6J413_9PEZI|nr:hypothetical protein CMUS01_14496 [Colletotrichum musicola]